MTFKLLKLYSVPDLYRACADVDYRQRVLMRAEAISMVFSEAQISKYDLCSRYADSADKFEVTLGDLTADGLAFAKAGFQNWLKNTDRMTGDITLEKYCDSLLKQWHKFKA